MVERKTVKACLIGGNGLLFVILLGLVFAYLPMQWRQTENASVTLMRDDGGMRAATLRSYDPNPFWFQAEERGYGANRIQTVYLQKELAAVSENYLRTYGLDTALTLEKQASSAADFCYTISGVPNGEVWSVWVVCARGSEPRVTVYTGEEAAK